VVKLFASVFVKTSTAAKFAYSSPPSSVCDSTFFPSLRRRAVKVYTPRGGGGRNKIDKIPQAAKAAAA
jgi:hypothetical protein